MPTIMLSEAYAMLDDLYSQLPKIQCKGLCADSCTDSFDVSKLEVGRIKSVTGIDLTPVLRHTRQVTMTPGAHGITLSSTDEPGRCPALGPLGTCRVYEVRPFICRAFGAVYDPRDTEPNIFRQIMMCDHGCMPEGTISMRTFEHTMIEIEMLSRVVLGET